MRYLIWIGIALLLGACNGKKPAAAVAAGKDYYYTCSMHPQVAQDGPGKCPICGMELIRVEKSMGKQKDDLVLSDLQVQLGNVQVDTVGRGSIGDRQVLTATVNVDETRSTSVSARVAGRIERLYYKSVGDYLHKGDKLYDLYSEALNNAKQEYLLALERQRTLDNGVVDVRALVEAARNRLVLWGMSDKQLQDLAAAGKASAVTTFYSPAEGYVMVVERHEGDYLSEGMTILRLADLSSVWVEGQVYTAQPSGIDRGAGVIVRLPDLPGKEWGGRLDFVNPEINLDTRINLVRVELVNRGGLLKPGMPADITIVGRQSNALTLPEEAVIRNVKSSVVWVEVGHNAFRSAMVKTGLEEGGRVEIRSGLKAGDVVVMSGAYLLNSEYIFRHGANP